MHIYCTYVPTALCSGLSTPYVVIYLAAPPRLSCYLAARQSYRPRRAVRLSPDRPVANGGSRRRLPGPAPAASQPRDQQRPGPSRPTIWRAALPAAPAMLGLMQLLLTESQARPGQAKPRQAAPRRPRQGARPRSAAGRLTWLCLLRGRQTCSVRGCMLWVRTEAPSCTHCRQGMQPTAPPTYICPFQPEITAEKSPGRPSLAARMRFEPDRGGEGQILAVARRM